MFSSKDKNQNGLSKKNSDNGSAINLIGSSTVISGEISTEGDLRIDGKVKGIVKSKAKVVFGETAVIEGNVYCKNADVSGEINGNIYTDELLHLKSTSKLKGDVYTNKLVVEMGTNLNGNCKMGEKMAEKHLKDGAVNKSSQTGQSSIKSEGLQTRV